MTGILYSVVGFVVALGILVTVHEFGHFWVARRVGVKVLRFSIGFGRPLWRRLAKDGTEYVIAAVPLGGYVKMLDENEGEVDAAEQDRAFNRQPVYKRTLVVLAGPGANFLFAVLAYWLVFVIGMSGVQPVVGGVAKGSLAQESGFQVGDRVLKVDGQPTQSWDEYRMYLFNRALSGATVRFEVRDADGAVRERDLDFSHLPIRRLDTGFLENAVGLSVKLPPIPAKVGQVTPGSPAARAGLVKGDRVTAANGKPVADWKTLVEIIKARPGKPTPLKLQRGDTVVSTTVVPEPVTADGRTFGRIGVAASPFELPPSVRTTVRFGPLAALWRGAENTYLMTSLTVRMLVRMVELKVSAKNISGPLTIAQYAGESAQVGFVPFLLFLAVVSVSLGVLNLLPVPILDGGHLLYYVVEVVRGGPLPNQVMLWGQQIGILLLVGLMGLAFYNDLARLLH